MPPEAQRDPTGPQEWLRRARSNLARARHHPGAPDILYEDLCFDAQQAAEKAIKAVLVARQIDFPKTHSIGDLLGILRKRGVPIPPAIREAVSLTGYAVESRYPGGTEDVTRSEHRWAVTLAEGVVQWAEKQTTRRKKQ